MDTAEADKLCGELKWEAMEVRKLRGIYMLMMGDSVQYVGQSSNIEFRVAFHLKEGKIPFRWAKIAKARRRDMDLIEERLIAIHDPPYNHTHTDKAHAPRGPRFRQWLTYRDQPDNNYERRPEVGSKEEGRTRRSSSQAGRARQASVRHAEAEAGIPEPVRILEEAAGQGPANTGAARIRAEGSPEEAG